MVGIFMRKKLALLLVLLLLAGMLFGCSGAKFTCGICGKEVKGVGHLVRAGDKTGRICDNCYQMAMESQG